MTLLRTLSHVALGITLLPPALSQTVHLIPARDCGAPELRLCDAAEGARALLIDRTTYETRRDPRGLPLGRVIAYRTVGGTGEARFALPPAAFRAQAPLAVVVVGPSGVALAGALTLPPTAPVAASLGAAQTREVIVSEFMKDPAAVNDAQGEWIEFYNPTATAVDIEGWVLGDGGNDLTVLANGGNGIVVPGFGLTVIARNADPGLNGGVVAAATYSGVTLANGADQILLSRPNGVLVDAVRYLDGPTWPDRPGASVSLSPRAWRTGHDDVALAWCEGESPMPGGDLGTPGRFNDTCWD